MNEDGIARRSLLAGAAGSTVLSAAARAQVGAGTSAMPPGTEPTGTLDLALAMRAPSTPTGVTISVAGRVFVFMPRFDDRTAYSVGEVARDGTVSPWPDAATNRPDPARPQETFFHVPNGVVDRQDRLWVLDAGLMAASGVPVPGAAKLQCFDLASGRVLRTIPLGPAVEPTSSLNDLRLRHGPDGVPSAAFISDQGQDGHGAILAVDLSTGRIARRLSRHFSTDSQKGILKLVEGRPLLKRGRDGTTSPVQGGANGIALSPDGKRVYYGPLMGRRLYAADADALLDPSATDAAVAATVRDLGERGLTGGLLCDDQDRVYLTLQEHNAVARRHPDGRIEVLASDPRLIWPDTLWITPDRTLFVSSSQVNRRAEYNGGEDRQTPPYALLSMPIDAGPV